MLPVKVVLMIDKCFAAMEKKELELLTVLVEHERDTEDLESEFAVLPLSDDERRTARVFGGARVKTDGQW